MRWGGFLYQKHYAGMSKRPLPASDAQVSDLLIFPLFSITASHAAFIFLCCVYGSHSFPYFSQSGQLIFFCMLSLADYALSLIFFIVIPAAIFFCTLPLADYALSLIFIFCTKSACKLLTIFSSGSSSCHAAVRQPVQPGLLQHDGA